MTVKELDPWQVTTGLPLDDVDATITANEFGFNAKIGAGRIVANMVITTDDDGEDHEQSFTIGDGWDIEGKGASVGGRKGGFNSQTNYGILVNSMVEACGGIEQLRAQLGADVDPRVAADLVGTRWHFGTKAIPGRKNPATGEIKESNVVVVTAFLGLADGTKTATKPKPGASATKPKSGGKPGLADTNPELFATLLELAGEHDDHDSFMAAALELAEVEADATAMNAVMSVKAGSVWAAK